MKKQSPLLRAITLSLILIIAISCVSLSPQSLSPTMTPGADGVSGGSGGGGGVNGGGVNGGGGSGSDNPGNPPLAETPEPTPGTSGPYIVKQTESLGGETISGQVCNVNDPFTVNNVSPKITFNMDFAPESADHGTLAYAYSFPSLGESHDATGTYTLRQADADGTLLLSMSVSDHVVFNGFDGIIPTHYQFDLVPSMSTSCPGIQ